MKIGILTFTDGTNYGQRLQNYALQNVLETMGNEVYTFEQVYKPSIKHIIKEMIVQFVHPQRAKQEKKRIEEFNRFNKQYIKFYERKLKLPEKKQWVDENFDLFLAGSDQIWNPYSPFVNENFFLTFASTDKRFSYAASFSVDNIPEDKYEQYVEWISGFQQISVREIRAQELINKMTGKKPELVIDPVLLLDKEQWKKITKPLSVNFPQKYIFSLFLGTGYQEEELIIEQQTGLKIIRMSDFYTLAPDEMLTLLENAALVLTDSYHITVFSIIFGVPYIVFQRKSRGSSMNSRFETLDIYFDIQSRFWEHIKDNRENWMESNSDTYMKNIMALKQKSLQYLQNVLESRKLL